MSSNCLLGIDGGGTKTVCLVSDEEGTILGRGEGGPSNHLAEGLERAGNSLNEAISQALKFAGLKKTNVQALCAGLAGVSRPQYHKAVFGILEHLLPQAKIVLEIDALIALLGATGGKPGIIVISGTGSIAFGVDSKGNRARAGGWGFILGDEGSGYDIARRGLIATLRAYDGRGPETILRERLSENLGLESTDEIVSFLYANPLSPGRVAALYPIVVQAADDGDQIARQLIQSAGVSLAEIAVAASTQLHLGKTPPLFSTAGGVFKGRVIQTIFQSELKKIIPEAQVVSPLSPPEIGALLLAKAHLEGRPAWKET